MKACAQHLSHGFHFENRRVTLRILPTHRRQHRHSDSWVPALALAFVLHCSGLGQEPAPETPPPAIPPQLPESVEKMPGDETLIPELPPGAVPIREYRRMPGNVEDSMEEDADEPAPVTEAPEVEPPASANAELSRDVAMNQALSTGETLLGGLGGLDGLLTSPFSPGSLLSEFQYLSGKPLQPIRFGSLDVNMHASVGVLGTHVGGSLFGDKYSADPLFDAGFTALLGRNTLSSLWASYNIASSFPESPKQSRELGNGGGSGGGGSGGVDQTFSLMANIVFPDLKRLRFVLGLDYASLSGFDRDTGGNAKRQIATALFIATYQQSKKSSLDWHVSAPFRLFSDAVSSSGVTSTVYETTQFTRKTRLGLGYTIGTLNVDEGKNQIYQQALVRWRYQPTRFLEFDVTGGLDFRDIDDSFRTTPIFGLSASWDSGKGTLVSLAAERRIFNAASSINTNFTSSSFVLRAAQRLGGGMIGTVSAGYEYTEYERVGAGGEGQRKDNLSYVAGGLQLPVSRHWSFSLNCSAGKNRSEVSAFDFVQTTLKTSLAF